MINNNNVCDDPPDREHGRNIETWNYFYQCHFNFISRNAKLSSVNLSKRHVAWTHFSIFMNQKNDDNEYSG